MQVILRVVKSNLHVNIINMPFNYFNVQDIYVNNQNNYVNLQVISEVHASDFTHIKNRFSLKICNKLRVDLIFLQVDIIYLAGRGQKYATIEKDTCTLKKSWKDLCPPPQISSVR